MYSPSLRRRFSPRRANARRSFEALDGRLMLDGAGHDTGGHIDPHSIDPQSDYFQLNYERVRNFAQLPDATTVARGDWSDPAVWLDGIVPQAGDKIQINHRITYSQRSFDAFQAININPGGVLSVAPDVDTRLEVGTISVLWGAVLEVGTTERPIADQVSAEIVFDDRPIDTTVDASQHGTGLLVLGGRLETNGRDRSHAFVEVAQGPSSGDRQLFVSEAITGWLPGDKLFLPDTRADGDFVQAEYATIESVAGTVLTLAAPLKYSHLGVGGNNVHVAHLGGNIVVRSEDPDGTRGHVLITERSEVEVHDAVWRDLGRTTVQQLDSVHFGPHKEVLHLGTNQVGRYSFHLHHVYGPEDPSQPYQFNFANNVIDGGEKWGLAIHDTHYGLVENNAVVKVVGAGIVFEDGSETGNVVRGNFTALHIGSGEADNARNNGADPQLVGDGTPENPYRTEGDQGHAGIGIWARGSNNVLVDNVVANAAHAGVFIWSRLATDRHLPAFRGADPAVDYVVIKPNAQVPIAFVGNEVYASAVGFRFGGAGQTATTPYAVSDLLAWSIPMAVEAFYSGDLSIKDSEFYGTGEGTGFQIHPSVQWIETSGVDVRGFAVGFSFGGTAIIENSHFDSTRTNISLPYTTPGHWNRGASHRSALPLIIDHVTFSGSASTNIAVVWPEQQITRNQSMVYPRDVYVYGYNGIAGDDFQIFMSEQSPTFVMPFSDMGAVAASEARFSPVLGASNQVLWDTYRLSVGGRLLPASAHARQGITGVVSTIPSDTHGPGIFDVNVEHLSPTTVVVTWQTDEPATSQLEWSDTLINQGAFGNLVEADGILRTSHSIVLNDLAAGSTYYYEVRSTDAAGNTSGFDFDFVQDVAKHASPSFTTSAAIVGRQIFYNGSRYDSSDEQANSLDDGAIATDKTALLPGQTASFVNYSSYAKGINGVMVDIAGLPQRPLNASDFEFRTGNNELVTEWSTLATSPQVSVRRDAGVNGASRVTLIWPSFAVHDQWLQVTVKANQNTGLAQPDLFYFGSAVGDTGNRTSDAAVSIVDELLARANASLNSTQLAEVTNRFDYNRDGRVSVIDQVISRNHLTFQNTELRLIRAPSENIAALPLIASALTQADDEPIFQKPIKAVISHVIDERSKSGPATTAPTRSQTAFAVDVVYAHGPQRGHLTDLADSLAELLLLDTRPKSLE